MGRDGLKHRRQLHESAEARELLELGDAIRVDETSTDRDSKFFRKPIAESVICKAVAELGQARLVEQTFDLVKPLAELEETIQRTREALDLPTKQKKQRLRKLLSIRDSFEPNCGEIAREAELLELHAAVRRLLRTKNGRPAGERRRLNRTRNIER